MKLFFMSLVWRASVSTHDFYRRVSAGPFEQDLKNMMTEGEPGTPEMFSVILARFDERAYTAILDPHPERLDGLNFFRFSLSGFLAHIKVDKRPVQDPLSDFIIRKDAPITVLLWSARASKDGALMRELARSALRSRRGGSRRR